MRFRSGKQLFVAIVAALLPAVESAQAAFPGANGRVAYSSVVDGESDIYVMDAIGTKAKPLTRNGQNDYFPSFSPDGKRIVFQSFRGGNPDLYLMKSDGSGQTRLTFTTAPESFPSWSPDGSRIVFEKTVKGNLDIYAMDAKPGAQAVRLTSDPGDDFRPAWSPDGNAIAFMSDRDGDLEIFVLPLDPATLTPGDPDQLTDNEFDDGSPDWSPSGSHLAYASYGTLCRRPSPCTRDIYVIAADGSGNRPLTTDASDDQAPDWSPDGSFILFTSDRDGDWDIYRMTPLGEPGTTPVNNSPEDEHSPD